MGQFRPPRFADLGLRRRRRFAMVGEAPPVETGTISIRSPSFVEARSLSAVSGLGRASIESASSVGSRLLSGVSGLTRTSVVATPQVEQPMLAVVSNLGRGSIVAEPTVEAPALSAVSGLGRTSIQSASLVEAMTIVEDAATTAWVAALTTPPTTARRQLYDDLIRGLKADGEWSTLDWLLILAAEDSQAALTNIVNPAKVAAAVNSPTFTASLGFTGNGTNSYITLGETLNAAGNHFALDSATLGAWINQSAGVAGSVVGTLSSLNASFTARGAGGNETFRINDGTAETARVGTTPPAKVGHRAISRLSSTDKRAVFNGVEVAALTTTSTSVPAGNGTIIRANTAHDPSRFAAYYSGGGLSSAALGRIHARLNTFLTAIGAN